MKQNIKKTAQCATICQVLYAWTHVKDNNLASFTNMEVGSIESKEKNRPQHSGHFCIDLHTQRVEVKSGLDKNRHIWYLLHFKHNWKFMEKCKLSMHDSLIRLANALFETSCNHACRSSEAQALENFKKVAGFSTIKKFDACQTFEEGCDDTKLDTFLRVLSNTLSSHRKTSIFH